MDDKNLPSRSAVETTARCVEAAKARRDELNCFLLLESLEAIKAAEASDARRAAGGARGPLDGVPIAVKDNIDVALLPTTNGTKQLALPARADAFCVARLRAAGAVLLGKLNMDEGAFGVANDNPHFGRAINPLRPGLTPGGSSGGAGAAIAAGLCPAALGTDTLGSVRIPAAYCGVVGVKPTRGLVSTRGVAPLAWSLDTVGVLARNVADAARVLETIAVFDPDCVGAVAAPTPLTLDAPVDLTTTVFGRPKQIGEVALELAVAQAFAAALSALQERGCRIVDVDLPAWQPKKTRIAGLLVIEAEAAVAHETALAREDPGLSEGFRALLRYGRDCGAGRLVKARRTLACVAHAVDLALAGVDALVLPTTPQRAFPFDGPRPEDQTSLTALANAGGHPAVSLPLWPGSSDLPVGLQLVGRRFDESGLLAFASAIEGSLPGKAG